MSIKGFRFFRTNIYIEKGCLLNFLLWVLVDSNEFLKECPENSKGKGF